MRFMSMVKSSEAQLTPPPKAFLEAMNRLIEESAKAGCVMVEAGGLLPTSNGARIRLSNGKVTVTDGPFAEAKEVIGGYAMFDVASKDEMIQWTKRFMDLHRTHLPGWEGEAEIRQVAGPDEKLCGQAHERHTVQA
jgi:hypothetical protein